MILIRHMFKELLVFEIYISDFLHSTNIKFLIVTITIAAN